LKAAEELGDPSDQIASTPAQTQQVRIAADEHVGGGRDGTLQDPIICWIDLDHLKPLGRFDEPGDDAQLLVGLR
jgi:hypothetical protein